MTIRHTFIPSPVRSYWSKRNRTEKVKRTLHQFESVSLADLTSSGNQPAQLWQLWPKVALHHTQIKHTHTHFQTNECKKMLYFNEQRNCLTDEDIQVRSLSLPLHTAGPKLDLAALYLEYTNTHTHSYCPSNCTAVDSQQEVPMLCPCDCSPHAPSQI